MNVRAYVCFALVVALWASTPVVVDAFDEEGIGVLIVLAFASAFAAGALLVGAAATGRCAEALAYTPRDWAIVAAMGGLGIVGYTSLYYLAIYLAPADEANVVNYLWPVLLVLLAGPILRERHDAWTWLGVGLSFVGVVGILTGWRLSESPTAVHLAGYGCAICGAFCWALFSVLGKRLRYDKLTAMALYCLVGAAVFGAALFTVFLFNPGPASQVIGNWPSAGAWVRLVYLGAAVNGVAYVLWFEALAGGPTALFGNLIFATPFLALVYLRVFGSVPFRGSVWISLVLIVAGSLISLNRAARMRTRT
jgi:drug/metabolite transporter (DMT)-like permease